MQKSDTMAELAKALVNVQSKLEGAKKDQENPFFKSKYADLTSVWNACRDLLANNGLSVVQTSSAIEGRELVLDTTLLHTSGEWISGQLSVPLAKSDPQGLGSAMTYARRYGLMAIVGICPEDDDAQSTIPAKKAEKPAQPKPATKSHINLEWLKESLDKLQDGNIEAWSNANILSFLKTKYKVEGKRVSEAVTKLDQKQSQEFIAEVHEALTKLPKLE